MFDTEIEVELLNKTTQLRIHLIKQIVHTYFCISINVFAFNKVIKRIYSNQIKTVETILRIDFFIPEQKKK